MRFFLGYFPLATLNFRDSVTKLFCRQLPQKNLHICSAGISAVSDVFLNCILSVSCSLLCPGVFGVRAVAFGAPDNAGIPVVAGVPPVGVSAVDDILMLLGHCCC